MQSLGILATLILASATPPPVPVPVLNEGDELVYVGTIHDHSTQQGKEYRRKFDLKVRVLTMGSGEGHSDVALLTQVRSLDDSYIKQAAEIVSGNTGESAALASTTLELIRLDLKGQMHRLVPRAEIPLRLNRTSTVTPLPDMQVEVPALSEWGMFVPHGADLQKQQWTVPAQTKGQPPMEWAVGRLAVRDGAQLVELVGTRQTPDWENPTGTSNAWRRVDRVWISPADGLTRLFQRTTERKQGIHIVHTLSLLAELDTPTNWNGERLDTLRREISFAYNFRKRAEDTHLESTSRFANDRLIEQIRQYQRDHGATSYRPAVDAILRRCESWKER